MLDEAGRRLNARLCDGDMSDCIEAEGEVRTQED